MPNHLETFKLERQSAFGFLLQQINLTVTSPLLYSNAPTIALQKSPCLCLARLLKGSRILPERLWQSALHPHCPRQRKCISSQSGHTIETGPEFQTWADRKALIFCVSRSLETCLSIVVWVDALLNTGLSHGTAIKTLLLATYFLVLGAAKNLLCLTMQVIKRDLTALCRKSPATCSILPCGPHHNVWQEGSSFINQLYLAETVNMSLGYKLAHCNQSWDPQAITFWKSRTYYQKLWKKNAEKHDSWY